MEYEKRRVEEENKLLDPAYEQSLYTEGLSTEGEPMVVKCIQCHVISLFSSLGLSIQPLP